MSSVSCTFLLLSCVSLVGAVPASGGYSPERCSDVLRSAGVSNEFAPHVAHALHSQTVNDLQRFNPSVTKDNTVPTINRDLNANESVLGYAPEVKMPNTDRWLTDMMKLVDMTLLKWGDTSYLFKYSSVLEMVVHEAHMQEHWANVRVQYDSIVKDKLVDQAACACLLDVTNNGVMQQLRDAAPILRDPKLKAGLDPSDVKPGDLRYYMTYIHYTSMEDPEVYKLTGLAAWKKFTEEALSEKKATFYDGAAYLYCKLN